MTWKSPLTSAEGETLRLLTEDKVSGNPAEDTWGINNVEKLALRRDGSVFF